MKKKITIIVSIIVVLIIAVGGAYLIDKNRMANNKPVIFSTWGYEYAPPEVLGEIVKITDRAVNEQLECADAEELFYEDSENEYYFNCIKSEYIVVEYENGYKEEIKAALESGNATLADLKRFNISYFTEKKQINEKQAVYDQSGDFLSLTLPEEWNYQIITDSNEQYKYSVKIYLDNSEKYAIVGSYKGVFGVCGTDLECEDIVSNDGIAINVGYYGNDWSFMTFGYENKGIVAMNNGLRAEEAETAIEILKTLKYEEYLDALTYTKIEEANLTSNEGVSLTELVRYDNKLYGINDTISLDYAGNKNGPIGKIDKLIDNQYIPKLNGETNSERFINSLVDYASEDSIILLVHGIEAVLFERVYFQKSENINNVVKPTEEEILSMYEKAQEIYLWFAETVPTEKIDYKNSKEDGVYLIKDERFSTLKELKEYMSGIFTTEIIEKIEEKIFDTNLIFEMNGKLYMSEYVTPKDIYCGEEKIKDIEYIDEDTISLTVSVEILDEELYTVKDKEEHTFILVYNNGEWKFSKFYCIGFQL